MPVDAAAALPLFASAASLLLHAADGAPLMLMALSHDVDITPLLFPL